MFLRLRVFGIFSFCFFMTTMQSMEEEYFSLEKYCPYGDPELPLLDITERTMYESHITKRWCGQMSSSRVTSKSRVQEVVQDCFQEDDLEMKRKVPSRMDHSGKHTVATASVLVHQESRQLVAKPQDVVGSDDTIQNVNSQVLVQAPSEYVAASSSTQSDLSPVTEKIVPDSLLRVRIDASASQTVAQSKPVRLSKLRARGAITPKIEESLWPLIARSITAREITRLCGDNETIAKELIVRIVFEKGFYLCPYTCRNSGGVDTHFRSVSYDALRKHMERDHKEKIDSGNRFFCRCLTGKHVVELSRTQCSGCDLK